MNVDTIVGIVAALVGTLAIIIFNSIRGSVRDLKGAVEKLDNKVEDIYGWSDRRFVEKVVCEERHKP